MKFAKSLSHQSQGFVDPLYAGFLFPYKEMKKQLKHEPHAKDTISGTIHRYAKQTDDMLKTRCTELFDGRTHDWCCWPWRGSAAVADASQRQDEVHDCLLLCQLNQQAFYKISKKCRKRGIDGMWQFYQEAKTAHRYHFLGSAYTTRLSLEDANEPVECPICLEESGKDAHTNTAFIILACGHYICVTCLQLYADLGRYRATLYNKLQVASPNVTCPVCRARNVFRDIKRYSFFPTNVNLSHLTV